MRAIILKQFGGFDSLAIENLPDPVPQPGSVLIEVKAFGGQQHLHWIRTNPMAKWRFESEGV